MANENPIVTEEIIDNPEVETEETTLEIPEDTENLEVDPDNPEETPEDGKEGETKEEDEEFNLDDMDFSEHETTFGKYDLSKFKDRINYENPEAMEAFNQEAKKMEELGFTQEQVEYICESVLGLDEEPEEPEKLTKKKVHENLKKHLTIEELRNYNAIKNFSAEALKGTELEGNTLEIVSNPNLMKLVNAIYRKVTGSKMINKSSVPEQKNNVKYTIEAIQTNYEKFLEKKPSQEEGKNYLSNMYKRIPDKLKKEFEFIYEGLFEK